MREVMAAFTKVFTGVVAYWVGCGPENKQRVYFANHVSHFDFLLLWAALPKTVRDTTIPAAAACYWGKNRLRQWFAEDVFNAVLVERENVTRANNPIPKLAAKLDSADSLIIFPEGGRGRSPEIREFKGGIYHLAKARPGVEFVPCYIDNAYRVLPKGEFMPLPILCSVTIGAPLRLQCGERKAEFLLRAQQALEACTHDHYS